MLRLNSLFCYIKKLILKASIGKFKIYLNYYSPNFFQNIWFSLVKFITYIYNNIYANYIIKESIIHYDIFKIIPLLEILLQ